MRALFAGGRGIVILSWLVTLPLVTPRIRGADEIEYFSYLRSVAFDGDLEFGNEYEHFHAQDPDGLAGFAATFLALREPATGRHINFAPLGTALLWSPFYVVAHGVALVTGAAADGFSAPYVAAACYASWLYGGLGLLLVQDALRRFGGMHDRDAGWATAAMLWATPLLYYMTIAPGFSHAVSVFAVAGLVWLSLWARWRGPGAWALVGLCGGLAALVREQDALFLCIPGLLLVAEASRSRRWDELVLRGSSMVAAAVAAFTPQLLAYRAINGTYAPSRLVIRKMSWSSPHFGEVMFDPGHGLFLWTPILLIAVGGLWAGVSRRKDVVAAVLLLAFVAQVWINGSVESWTQAGAFGSRRFVGATAIFAWGLAMAATALRERLGPAFRVAVLAVFAWWNVSLMVQFGLKLMDRQSLEWPRVAVNQVTEVPRRIARTAVLYFTDRERLVREGR